MTDGRKEEKKRRSFGGRKFEAVGVGPIRQFVSTVVTALILE